MLSKGIIVVIEQGIDEIVLKNMSSKNIESLIPKLGHRIKFHLKWKEWLGNNSVIEQEEIDQNNIVLPIIQNDKDESNAEVIADLNLSVIETPTDEIQIINTLDASDKTAEKYVRKIY